MSHHEHHHHHDHEMPTSGRALDALALSATLHCLTGCAIGEVLGMIIGPPVKLVGVVVVLMAVFGTAVLVAEGFDDDDEGGGDGGGHPAAQVRAW